jgi:hypothetical protein
MRRTPALLLADRGGVIKLMIKAFNERIEAVVAVLDSA